VFAEMAGVMSKADMAGRPIGRYSSQDARGFYGAPLHGQDAKGFRNMPVRDQDATGFRSVPEDDRTRGLSSHGPSQTSFFLPPMESK